MLFETPTTTSVAESNTTTTTEAPVVTSRPYIVPLDWIGRELTVEAEVTVIKNGNFHAVCERVVRLEVYPDDTLTGLLDQASDQHGMNGDELDSLADFTAEEMNVPSFNPDKIIPGFFINILGDCVNVPQ